MHLLSQLTPPQAKTHPALSHHDLGIALEPSVAEGNDVTQMDAPQTRQPGLQPIVESPEPSPATPPNAHSPKSSSQNSNSSGSTASNNVLVSKESSQTSIGTDVYELAAGGKIIS